MKTLIYSKNIGMDMMFVFWNVGPSCLIHVGGWDDVLFWCFWCFLTMAKLMKGLVVKLMEEHVTEEIKMTTFFDNGEVWWKGLMVKLNGRARDQGDKNDTFFW